MKKLMYLIFLFVFIFNSVGLTGIASANENPDKTNVQKAYQKYLKKKQASLLQSKSSNIKVNGVSYPEFLISNPDGADENVPTNQIVDFQFEEKIYFKDVDKVTLWETPAINEVPIEAVIRNNTLYIISDDYLKPYQEYFAYVEAGAVSFANGHTNDEYGIIFTTGGNIAPIVSSITPFEGETGVPANTSITITYDKAIKPGSNNNAFLIDSETGQQISASLQINGDKLIVTPDKTLGKNKYYILRIGSGVVKDGEGNDNFRHLTFFATNEEGEGLVITLEPKKSAKIKVSGGKAPYTVTTSNSSVATASVKSNYVTISGKGKGNAIITLKDKNGNEIDIEVFVIDYTVSF